MSSPGPLALGHQAAAASGYRVVDLLVDLLAEERPCVRRATPAEMARRVAAVAPDGPQDLGALLRTLRETVLPYPLPRVKQDPEVLAGWAIGFEHASQRRYVTLRDPRALPVAAASGPGKRRPIVAKALQGGRSPQSWLIQTVAGDCLVLPIGAGRQRALLALLLMHASPAFEVGPLAHTASSACETLSYADWPCSRNLSLRGRGMSQV
jgi:hypothetical protein